MSTIPQLSQATLDGLAMTLHDQCLKFPSNHVFTTNDLEEFLPAKYADQDSTKHVVGAVANFLTQSGRLQVLLQDGKPVFRAVSREQTEKLKSMSGDERMLYGYIQDSGSEGIWLRTLRTKCNMQQTAATKALKQLEKKKFVKAVKDVKHPTHKIYMLYELTPSVDVSGGPWFTDSELDSEFINELLVAMTKFIAARSFPKSKDATGKSAVFPPAYTGYPSLNQVYMWVKNSGVTEVDLAEADIKSLLDVLVYDGKIERIASGGAYKAMKLREDGAVNGFTESPCGRCPVFSLCKEGGPVSASNCKYFEDWLNGAD